MTRTDLKNKLANYYHESWSYWMKYLFQNSTLNNDGTVTIPSELVRRWKRQSSVDFKDLSVKEKDIDLDEADNLIKLLPIWKEEKNE